MKIEMNSDDDFALKKKLKLCNIITDVGSVFDGCNKYYLQVFFDESLYKLQMLKYDRTDVSKSIDVNSPGTLLK